MTLPNSINIDRHSESRIQSAAVAYLMGIMPAKEIAYEIGVTPAMISKVSAGETILSAPKARALSVLASVNGHDEMANDASAPWKLNRPVVDARLNGDVSDEVVEATQENGLAILHGSRGEHLVAYARFNAAAALMQRAALEHLRMAGYSVTVDPAQTGLFSGVQS